MDEIVFNSLLNVLGQTGDMVSASDGNHVYRLAKRRPKVDPICRILTPHSEASDPLYPEPLML